MEKQNIILKIGTFNIRNGLDVGYDYSVIANDIVKANIDICGLQEVDERTIRNNDQDTMKLISDTSGYKYFKFSKAIDFEGGEYGTGILSKYPILCYKTYSLESDNHEKRSLGHAVIDVNGEKIDFFNTHLSFESIDTRKKQFIELSKIISTTKKWVLTGDFNTEDFCEFKLIKDSILVNNQESKMLSFSHSSAIDNIVLPSSAKIIDEGIFDKIDHSDHNMIYANILFEYKK